MPVGLSRHGKAPENEQRSEGQCEVLCRVRGIEMSARVIIVHTGIHGRYIDLEFVRLLPMFVLQIPHLNADKISINKREYFYFKIRK